MNANPFEAPQDKAQIPSNLPRKKGWRWFASKWLFITAGLFLLVAMLIPAPRRAREASRRAGCINNIRQIQLAILNYESATGRLPPAYTIDEHGNRLHSWRSLILPFMEEGELHESIDFTKPWDDPANAEARLASIIPYMCPSATHGECKTTYMAIVGPNHVFSGSKGREWSDFQTTGNPAKWAAIMEVPSDEAIHWMSPHDADEEFLNRLSVNSQFNHDAVFMVAFLDNHVQSFSTDGLDFFRDNVPNFESVNMEDL